jgi:hypothetical protein
MARCLRCKAGPEWIEGNVSGEATIRDLRAKLEAAEKKIEELEEEQAVVDDALILSPVPARTKALESRLALASKQNAEWRERVVGLELSHSLLSDSTDKAEARLATVEAETLERAALCAEDQDYESDIYEIATAIRALKETP